MSDRLRRIDDPADILFEAAAAAGRHLGLSRAGYAEVDPANGTLRVERDWTDGTVMPGVGRHSIAAFGSRTTAMLYGGETQRIEDVRTDPRISAADRPAFAAMDIVAAITVPLVRDGRLLALFSVHKSAPCRWSEADVRLVEQVAQRTFAAHELAATAARLRDSEARLAFLLELSDRTRGETDAATILEATSELLAKQLDLSRVTFGEVDEKADLIRVKHAWGYGMPATQRVHRLSDFGTDLVAEHKAGRTFVSADASTDARIDPALRRTASETASRAVITRVLVRDGELTAYLSKPAQPPASRVSTPICRSNPPSSFDRTG